jgi:hypothetical protein
MSAMEKRLLELREELDKGRKQLDHLDYQRKETRDTMLRISGAIQALEELLKEENGGHDSAPIFMNGVPVGAVQR